MAFQYESKPLLCADYLDSECFFKTASDVAAEHNLDRVSLVAIDSKNAIDF